VEIANELITACAHCGSTGEPRWVCRSCARVDRPALFCCMPCVWAHGPIAHHDLRDYQIERSSDGHTCVLPGVVSASSVQ
jgi:hypothetical protein